ncbi:phage tail protein [Aquabacterium sp. OR-4]|uniref:phage tail protein n=1 Tax=Aquabacterium sp. OR-4 TaxID=2978127 RepID=UPI0028C98B33|nr:phage tail protein [Aquabacterium sp. OR-4]MDT7836447.1 phage tail protein [Aquabacterium sp. OR-4]
MMMYSVEIAATVAVVSSVAVTADQQRKQKNQSRDAYNASLRDRYVMVRGATEPRQFVLGRQRVSGPIAFLGSTGAHREKLCMVVLMAAHQIDGFERYYIGDEVATVDGAGNVIALQRTDEFAISTAAATVTITAEPASGTVSAEAVYGSTAVPLTVTAVSGTSISVAGATAGTVGTLVITYQPASNPWMQQATGMDLQASGVLDSSGNCTIALAGEPVVDSVRAVLSNNQTGQDYQATDVLANVSITGATAFVSGLSGAMAGYPVHITYRTEASSASVPRMRIRAYTGAPGQAADAALMAAFPGIWTGLHTLTDTAALVVECDYDPDAFPGGLPNISAVLRGALLFDPRDGATRWSENPALMCRYVATHPLLGMQPGSAVADANIAAQATVCDEVSAYVLSGRVHTRPRYTAGLVVKAGARPADYLNDLCDAMAGEWVVVDGQLRLRAGAPVTPLQTLDASWLADGEITVQGHAALAASFNAVTGKFIDEDRHYRELDYPAVRSATYIDDDRAELPREMSLPAVPFSGQAQQVAAVRMRRQRWGRRLSLPCNMRAFAVEPFDVLQVQLDRFGLAGQQFEVLDAQWTPGGIIRLELQETDASIWALGSSFAAADPQPRPTLPSPWYVPSVQGLAAYSGTAELQTQADGTVVSTLRITWTPIADRYVVESGGGVEVRYGLATEPESTWRTVRAPEATGTVRVADVYDGRMYLIKARAYSAMAKGPWSATLLHAVVGKQAPPSNVASFAASVSKGRAVWSWAVPVDADWDVIEIRATNADWGGASAPLFRGRASQWAEVVTVAGTLTRYARHVDTTGNVSGATATAVATVLAGDLVQDGATTYTWIAYANSSDGSSGFTTGAWSGQTYLGVATNKTSATEGTNPADYTWSLIKGEQGDPGTPGGTLVYKNTVAGPVTYSTIG